MQGITDADREAARALRETLADVSGFWFRNGDDGPLCAALARHRAEAERRLLEYLVSQVKKAAPRKTIESRPARIANDLGANPPRSSRRVHRAR